MLLLQLVAAAAAANWTQLITFHVLDPSYTGVRNKNTGDFAGDLDFIMGSFDGQSHPGHEGINYTLLEQVLVEVNGDFGLNSYALCNVGALAKPCDDDAYSCPGGTKAGRQKKDSGYWYSWPKVAEGKSWRQLGVQRRIKSSCLAEAWRKEAGGCPACGKAIESTCVQTCIQGLDNKQMKKVWDTVLNGDATQCPDQPMPCKATPSPLQPRGDMYTCEFETAQCVLSWEGHDSKESCQAACIPMYVCSNYECKGIGANTTLSSDLGTCKKICERPEPPAPPAPPTPPPAGTLYKCLGVACVADPGGIDLQTCQSLCHAPLTPAPPTPRPPPIMPPPPCANVTDGPTNCQECGNYCGDYGCGCNYPGCMIAGHCHNDCNAYCDCTKENVCRCNPSQSSPIPVQSCVLPA